MRTVQIVLILVLVVVAGLVAYIAMRNPQPPLLPADADHARWIDAKSCLGACHGNAGESPRTRNHPVGEDCMRCHGRR